MGSNTQASEATEQKVEIQSRTPTQEVWEDVPMEKDVRSREPFTNLWH